MNSDSDQITSLAIQVLARCALRPDEVLFIVTDDGTMPELADAFADAGIGIGAAVRILAAGRRSAAFEELPAALLDRILSPGLVVDLTRLPWLYSDSLTRYATECAGAGSRLPLTWGDENLRSSLGVSPLDDRFMDQAVALTPTIAAAAKLRIRSTIGTDFHVEMLQRASMIGLPPVRSGDISAPLYASVTAPFSTGSALGRLIFQGAGHLQGPDPMPFYNHQPAEITVVDGYVQQIEGAGEVAEPLRLWRRIAPSPEIDRIMDCNIVFDPRGILEEADNLVVHCYQGGIMIGIGSPYEFRAEGSLKPGYHLDLLFTDCDVDLDGAPLLSMGTFA